VKAGVVPDGPDEACPCEGGGRAVTLKIAGHDGENRTVTVKIGL
jgi:hypothetical protein